MSAGTVRGTVRAVDQSRSLKSCGSRESLTAGVGGGAPYHHLNKVTFNERFWHTTLQIKVIDETNKLLCVFGLYITVYIIFTLHYILYITAVILINCFKIGFPSLVGKMVVYSWFKINGWMDDG